MSARPRVRAITLCVLLILMAGISACSPDVYFLGDPALAAATPDLDRFESQLQRAGRESNYSVDVLWDPSQELGTGWLEQELELVGAESEAVVLSPYFSLFANELSEEYPELSLVALSGGAEGPSNLLRVAFERTDAFRSLGQQAFEWEKADEERSVAALFLADSQSTREELAALREGYAEGAGEELSVQEFSGLPDRDTVRRFVRDLIADGVNAFLVFLGSANRYALELLQTEPVVFATEHGARAPALDDALLLSIEYPLAVGLAAALDAIRNGRDGVVRVPAEVVRGGGFERPEFTESPPQPAQ